MVAQYQKGNKAVLEELYIKNKGIISILSNKFYTDDRITEKSDLMQEGFFGLLKAVEMFDSSKGVKFTTYLTKWVYTKMQRYVTTRSTGDKEISLYTPTVEDMCLEETIKDDTDYIEEADYRLDNQLLRKELEEAMYKNLTLREREVIHLRYGFDCQICTLNEIDAIMQLKQNQAKGIHQIAIRKMRTSPWGRKKMRNEIAMRRAELMSSDYSYKRVELNEEIERMLKELKKDSVSDAV